MLDLQKIQDQAIAVQNGTLSAGDFEDWFSDYSRGYRGPRGNITADALSEIDMVLVNLDLGELVESDLGDNLVQAIHGFLPASQPNPEHPPQTQLPLGWGGMREWSNRR